MPDIDLPKLAGVAGSAVALIIATAIFQSWLTARYVPAFDRYRALADELRSTGDQARRRSSLRTQLSTYRKRLWYLSVGSEVLDWVLLCAVATITLASASILLPKTMAVAIAGTATLFVGLALLAASAVLELLENRLDRRAIESEIDDLDEVPNSPVLRDGAAQRAVTRSS